MSDMDVEPTLVRRAMTSDAERITPHDSLQTAAQRMKALNVGFLAVYQPPAGVVGVITDRDIAVRAVAAGRDPAATEVHEAMTAQVVTCYDDDELAEAARVMERHGLRRLIVLNRAHEMVGVLSVDDVAEAIGGTALAGDILRYASHLVR